MKKAAFTTSYLHYITLGIICQVFFLVFSSGTPVNANTNNFYFSDFTADYYLEKTPEASKLKVSEQLTAEFPDYDQNHGIERSIPFTNQGGANLTAPSINDLHFTATRNGQPESINSTDTINNAYVFQLGDANNYVHNTQKYQLSYEFTNVITDQNNFQELYWDTNGTGWHQRFDHLTANFHLQADLLDNLRDDTWCYVGTQGSNNQSRCTTTKTEDGFTFTTDKLLPGENLTFVINFATNTFIVPPPRNNPTAIIFLCIACGISVLILICAILSYRKYIHPKRAYYKQLFTPPQYTTHPNVTVAEAATIYLGNTKSPQVATLLELAVNHKIELIKGEKKSWRVKIKDVSNLTPAQSAVLQILQNSSSFQVGDEFTIDKQTYSTANAARAKLFNNTPKDTLTEQGFFEPTTRKNSQGKRRPIRLDNAFNIIFGISLLASLALAFFAPLVTEASTSTLGSNLALYIYILCGLNFVIFIWHNRQFNKYAARTEKGLDLSNYYQGLRDYIQLAEQDRLKFLQSVDGADTTPQGIVKLYEKVLPYAILFGLEQSWLTELAKYYEENPELSPSWCMGTNIGYLSTRDFNTFSRSITNSYSSASSSSSSSSGSGGGGFSGGGGGGGGGGGW